MATYAITIAGVSRSIQPGWTITESANSRNRMDFRFLSLDGTVRLANDDEVIFTEDGTRIFGGLIDNPSEAGFGGASSTSAIEQSVSAVDFNVYPSRITVGTATDRPSETLAARLAWIAGLMSGQGVSLSGTQATGPTLIAASYTADQFLVDVLNETMALASGTGSTSWVWDISYSKVLKATETGTVAAPFNIADGDGQVLGDITVRQPRPSTFANYIILLGGQGTHDASDAFTGDGVTSDFALTYTLASTYGFVYVDGVAETLAIQGTGFDLAATWLYYSSDNTIRRVPGAGPPAASAAITVSYAAQYPVRVTSDSGASAADRVQKVYTAPEVFDIVVMQALADAYLARDSVAPKTVQYGADYSKTGLHPGQTQTITIAKRNLSGTHLLTEVRIVHLIGSLVQRQVTAVSTTRLPITLREQYQQSFGGGGSAAAAGGVTVVTGGTFLTGPTFLGGSREVAQPMAASPAYTPVASYVPFVATSSFTGTVRVELWARTAGVGVTARLRNVTDSTTAGTSSTVTSTSPTEVTFSVSIVAGKKYRLEIISNAASQSAYGIGVLEAA